MYGFRVLNKMCLNPEHWQFLVLVYLVNAQIFVIFNFKAAVINCFYHFGTWEQHNIDILSATTFPMIILHIHQIQSLNYKLCLSHLANVQKSSIHLLWSPLATEEMI